MIKDIDSYFTDYIRYLGPLRDDPRAIYGIPNIPEMKDLGLKGEYTAAILDHYQELEISYPSPHSKQLKRATLGEAVSEWLQKMGLVDQIETRDRGKMGTELSIHSLGVKKNLDLTNVGFGVSQVLPTLVIGLLASNDTTLMFEQPELHLHPKVQSIIGDFFLGLAEMGKQCIVETHSEYLVNRLRRRIAESSDDSVIRLSKIYFVERRDGTSQFRAINLNEFGAVLEWPDGFFDEGPNEAQYIMQAALEKRNLINKKDS